MIRIAKNIQNDLSNLIVRNERTMLIAVRRWFYVAHNQIRKDLTTKFIKDVASELTDWGFIEEQGQSIIKPATLSIMQSGGNTAYSMFKVKGAFDVLNVRAVTAADKYTAFLVREVTAETKAGIRTFISTGVKAGKSMPKLARELRPLVGLTQNQTQSVMNYRLLLEDKVKFPKLTETDINRKVQRYADKTHRRRAATIARTETARAQNIGYVQGLENVGVAEAEFSASPSACDQICVPLDGTKFPLADAESIIPAHPNCRCAMLPVIGDKAMENKADVAGNLEAHTDKLMADLETAGPVASKNIQSQLRRLGQTPGHTAIPTPTPTLMPKPAVPVEFVGKVSDDFKGVVTKQIDAYPDKVKTALNDNGFSFVAGDRTTSVFPELKGLHPRGWPSGTTWDSVEGMFYKQKRLINVCETYRPIRQKTFKFVPLKRRTGVLNHETGHAFDYSLRKGAVARGEDIKIYSETKAFRDAYKIDMKHLPESVRFDADIRYYRQKGGVGQLETFAEVFADIMGQGSGDRDMMKFFPNCTKYIEDLLK